MAIDRCIEYSVLEIWIFLNWPNSMNIPKSCFKLDHFNSNLGKIYRPIQDLNWPSSILTGLGQFLLFRTLNIENLRLGVLVTAGIPMHPHLYILGLKF